MTKKRSPARGPRIPCKARYHESQPNGHAPVMLQEVLEALSPRDGAIYLDGTFGGGGYSTAILDAADCRVWAIDRDPQAIAAGRALVERYAGRLKLIEGCFGNMEALLPDELHGRLDGIALDLGVSSMQLDQAERGFSIKQDGPLDMRMSGSEGRDKRESAAEVIMTLSEADLADILFRYGEERMSRQVARAIVAARQTEKIERTSQLAAIVRAVVTRGKKRRAEGEIDPATRSFQGIRIYVNDELGELERGLMAAERLLAAGGRLAVLSFHSLEDRLTKAFLRERSGEAPRPSRHAPAFLPPCRPGGEGRIATFASLFRGVKKPGQTETAGNPRARSARLRAATRTTAPAGP